MHNPIERKTAGESVEVKKQSDGGKRGMMGRGKLKGEAEQVNQKKKDNWWKVFRARSCRQVKDEMLIEMQGEEKWS